MKPRREIYDTYWYFAAERQNIFFRRLHNTGKVEPTPYTQDPVLQTYKFCNTYRINDRVSQFLTKKVIYADKYISVYNTPDTAFRIILFRLLNKLETWELLEEKLGEISLKNFNFQHYASALEEIRQSGQPIYGNAFILCANKHFGYEKKHENHLALLELIFKTKTANKILNSKTLEQLFKNLKELPLIGDFMAYQIAIDLNYSELFDFSENDFTVAGPGAKRGIKKCFEDTGGKSNEYIIKHMVENQSKEFTRLGLDFKDLFGRPLHAIDCQGLFCETDKYCRVKFPDLKSNRTRIKAKYTPTLAPITYFYPPKWKIDFEPASESN